VKGRVPIRTCVGCGDPAPQPALLRFVADGGALRLDGERTTSGRGAYLHRDPACWQTFVRRRGPVRSLRSNPGRLERERLVELLGADVR